jgi:glutamyl-tRNA synthetase
MHMGHAQTLLLAWLQIRALGGAFVLRIEDIDRARCKPGASEQILRDLTWLGFDWDEGPDVGGPHGPYLQSQRQDLYRQKLALLKDCTFACSCSRKELRSATARDPDAGEWPYPGTCRLGPRHPGRPTSVRARVDPETITWNDLYRGHQQQDPSLVCGDFILWSKADEPTYQLAVVVDDVAQGITHVLRGADLIASTARQLLLYRWLGASPPQFAHAPLRRDDSGQRLAKSRGSPGLAELRKAGVDPRQLIGQLAADLGIISTAVPAWPRELVEPFASWTPGRALVGRRGTRGATKN